MQTKTHLVPEDKSIIFMRRIGCMVDLICQHVWQRDYNLRRERKWMHGGEFAIDNRPVWFLVDHHGCGLRLDSGSSRCMVYVDRG